MVQVWAQAPERRLRRKTPLRDMGSSTVERYSILKYLTAWQCAQHHTPLKWELAE